MTRLGAGIVRQRQDPLRDRYRQAPGDAKIIDGAETRNACGGDPFHGAVEPANSPDAPLRFGIHRAVGGDHDLPNPGDVLCAALAACFDSTLRMLADHLGIDLAFLEVKVNAECDVRGCLLVEPTVPVGFQRIHCVVNLRPRGALDVERTEMLVAAAERCCVVLQTLRNGAPVETRCEVPADEVAAGGAPPAHAD